MSTEQSPTPGESSTIDGNSSPQEIAADTSSSRLANRYGAPKPGVSSRTKKISIIVALGLTIVLTGVFTAMFALKPVSTQDVGFSIGTDDLHAVVDYQITKAPESTVECAVSVLSENYAIVGWKTVTIGPSDEQTTAHRTQLRLESPGVSGGIDSCWILDTPT
ncbi:DUF4307 domain-containing protein [Arthrobacter roseus]|uniref:DUF4307 domain-containing protein n=1 Tax=Arthrobacter roseus TaxID=136274 RepID=UPI0019623F05|nr:DUF4307 domain-containing protein [Arthrobacter roseus]MBM7847977.1 hypothetical protein [Arthrobacter roseus]